MPTITLMVGPPGSGKSTWSHSYVAFKAGHGQEAVRVSQDDQGKEDHMTLFNESLAKGLNIVVDRMNFDKNQRNRYLEPARKAGYATRIVITHCPLATCLERCNARENHPTIKDSKTASQAVNFFFKSYERVSDDEADEVFRLGWIGNDAPKAVICDLDGTLCNVEHRRHFVRPPEGQKKNWPAFFAGIKDDTVNKACEELLTAMAWSGYKIVYCSGRSDNERKATVEWLNTHKLDKFEAEASYLGPSPLYMRGRSDSRRDDVVKEIILDFEILTRFKPAFMIDDRDQVVAMWRRRGFTCLQIDYGDF